MLEHHQEAINQALTGNFIPLNLIELKMAVDAGLHPRRAGQNEDDAVAEFNGFKIINQIFTPTGRASGYNWGMACKACSGVSFLYADADNGKSYRTVCPICDGSGHAESDLVTDFNGVVIGR